MILPVEVTTILLSLVHAAAIGNPRARSRAVHMPVTVTTMPVSVIGLGPRLPLRGLA